MFIFVTDRLTSAHSYEPVLDLLSPSHWNIILHNLLLQPGSQRCKIIQNSLSRHLPVASHLLQQVRPGGGGASSQKVLQSLSSQQCQVSLGEVTLVKRPGWVTRHKVA